MRFKDRHDAGRRLAAMLGPFIRRPAIVYALPRGGVPLGVEIALANKLPLDLIISRKVGHPMQPEYAVCAVTESGESVCNPFERAQLDAGWLAKKLDEGKVEAQRRRALYGQGHPRRPATGQCAIVVDDGVATGLTLEAAIRDIRAERPSRIVVAVAVAPAEARERFRALCDDFVAVQVPEIYEGAVGAYYERFGQLNDDDVLREMARVPGPLPLKRAG